MKFVLSQGYPIPGCARLLYKDVRTGDNKKIGVVYSEDEHFIIVHSPRARQYRIPRSAIKRTDGSQVLLGISSPELRRYGL
jgi:hypothetical protein